METDDMETDDMETTTLEKYAQKTLLTPAFDASAFFRLITRYKPPAPPTRWERVRAFVRAHVPTIHPGPCDHEYC